MKEKEINEIIATVEKDAKLTSAEDYREVAIIRIQADIARQLTRIADKLDERWNFDKEADDLADEVNAQLERGRKPPSLNANICFEILAKAFFYDTKMMAPGKSIAPAENPPYTEKDRSEAWDKWLKENDVPEPAPDALVEAVKNYLRSPQMTKYGTKYLEDALDAHEKEKSHGK